ncbi:uncharacterized protein LOC108149393 [Drosophila elegans]|uniref:uncharacterized protein LOC108149393 n=1 Tax=Drosophila elegans TaxID=30023 RepID=UPI0007E884F4|nr:uncharacterized protein LOC108149393 [Drosophila elegans]
MSCLTSILQLLQFLTTLSGCNIYRYVEGKQIFRLSPKINSLVGAMHRFWLRPWLVVTFLMHLIFWMVEFLNGMADPTPGSERPLHLIYTVGLTIASTQNFCISIGIAYHYRYHRNLMRQVLNGFASIYFSYEKICGRAPKINWWFFGIQTYRVLIASFVHQKTSILAFGTGSQMNIVLRVFGLLFVCIQPFLLSMVVHLGILVLYACYDIQINPMQSRKSLKLNVFHRKLIRLRHKFDCLARPFVWTVLLENFLLFIGNFHLVLYDQQSVKHLGQSLFGTFIFPIVLLHVNVAIKTAEKTFGQFKANFRPQRQTQLLWLYRQIMETTADRNNVFRLDRGLILEMLRLGWVFAMFANSLLLNSTAKLRHFEAVKYKKFI